MIPATSCQTLCRSNGHRRDIPLCARDRLTQAADRAAAHRRSCRVQRSARRVLPMQLLRPQCLRGEARHRPARRAHTLRAMCPRRAVPVAAKNVPAVHGAHAMSPTTEKRQLLVRAGYLPIPLYGKAPPIYGKNNKRKGLSEWEKLCEVTPQMLAMWERTWPDASNTGMLTKQVPALDADILNEEAARAVEDHVRNQYEDRGYFLTRIGLPPKRAFLFRTDEPFKKIVVNITAPNGDPEKPEKIEFLGDGQQLACFGAHPDTGKPYIWHGGEPGEIKREDLPYIREEEAQKLVHDI